MSSFWDRYGAGRCVGGEHRRPALQVRRDGALIDLAGSWAYRIFVPGADTVEYQDEVVLDAGTRVTFDLPGSVTAGFVGRTDLQHAVSRDTADGFRNVVEGKFTARAGGPERSLSGDPGAEVMTVDEAGVMTLDAFGPQGPSPWGAADQTRAQYNADVIAAAIADYQALISAEPREPDATDTLYEITQADLLRLLRSTALAPATVLLPSNVAAGFNFPWQQGTSVRMQFVQADGGYPRNALGDGFRFSNRLNGVGNCFVDKVVGGAAQWVLCGDVSTGG